MERDSVGSSSGLPLSISTHTLTWSVTSSQGALMVDMSNFNSHAHVERDRIFTYFTDIDFNFNSHAHVERDPFVITSLSRVTNFNSHAHVERDLNNKSEKTW